MCSGVPKKKFDYDDGRFVLERLSVEIRCEEALIICDGWVGYGVEWLKSNVNEKVYE